jgi:hypothetical protein
VQVLHVKKFRRHPRHTTTVPDNPGRVCPSNHGKQSGSSVHLAHFSYFPRCSRAFCLTRKMTQVLHTLAHTHGMTAPSDPGRKQMPTEKRYDKPTEEAQRENRIRRPGPRLAPRCAIASTPPTTTASSIDGLMKENRLQSGTFRFNRTEFHSLSCCRILHSTENRFPHNIAPPPARAEWNHSKPRCALTSNVPLINFGGLRTAGFSRADHSTKAAARLPPPPCAKVLSTRCSSLGWHVTSIRRPGSILGEQQLTPSCCFLLPTGRTNAKPLPARCLLPCKQKSQSTWVNDPMCSPLEILSMWSKRELVDRTIYQWLAAHLDYTMRRFEIRP